MSVVKPSRRPYERLITSDIEVGRLPCNNPSTYLRRGVCPAVGHEKTLLPSDVERGGTPDEEDSVKPLLGADDTSKIKRPKVFSIEEMGADRSLPTCSIYTDNQQNHANSPESESPADTASRQVARQKELNNRLLSALFKPKVDNDEVQKLLEEGADPNATCTEHDRDVYACHIAGMFDKNALKFTKKIRLLADVCKNWTPLQAAAFLNHLEAVRILLAAHADPNICDNRGRTPLDVTGLVTDVPIAMNMFNFTEVLKLLIDAGGRQNTMVEDHERKCQTPLHIAVKYNNLDAVKLLLSHGASAGCWNIYGYTPLHLCINTMVKTQNSNIDIWKVLLADNPDVVDDKGRTPLRAAIEAGWLEGAQSALLSGADVTLQASDGQTPLHIMARDRAGWYDIRESDTLYDYDDHEKILRDDVLNNMISVAKETKAIDCVNGKGVTPLFLAVRHNKYLIAKKLLQEGASISPGTPGKMNVIHIAAKHGHETILRMLLDFDKVSSKVMVNSLTHDEGYGPIHFAVARNHLPCVDVLKRRSANLCLKTGANTGKWKIPYPKDTTPLHMAAANGNLDIATSIMQYYISRKLLQERDGNGLCPLHSAIIKSNVNIVKYLVLEHHDSLITPTHSEKPETALSMIVQHVTNPTDFLEDILDSCISYTYRNEVEISYRVLMPNRSIFKRRRYLQEEMDVIEELLKTGDEFHQKRLLLHPLIESFIHLKWQTMKPYYLLIASMYTLFLLWLLGFEVSVFYDKDVCKTKPSLLISILGGFIIYSLTLLIILQELLMNYEGTQYFKQWRTWLKLGSLMPALIVPPALTTSDTAEWPRHVSSLALFLVCFQMMNLLSQFPSWGYYVVMLKRVAINVFKILATFSILLVCFAFSFKIQFRSEYPFNGTWDAIVKTFFMLSSEFEYNEVFNSKKAAALGSSFEVVRIILLAFLVLAAIVLINMMVGVAVDDINELKAHGKIGRLEKQAHFIRSLDRLNYNIWNSFLRWMPQSYQRRKFPSKIILAGDILTQVPDNGYNIEGLPKRIKDDFYCIAQKNKQKKDGETNKDVQLRTEKDKIKLFENTIQRLNDLEASVTRISCDLNTKVDHIIKTLESKARPRRGLQSRLRLKPRTRTKPNPGQDKARRIAKL